LDAVLKGLRFSSDPNLLVGFNKADDAGIYKISETQALVQTVDFFPPIVDDPYAFGQIAAANALSDIYAMGGRPLTALNIVGFPPGMPPDVLVKILQGGADKVQEAGAAIVGGHSIKDKELKYGLACTGLIDIDKIISNDKARNGDHILLTKPLGTGIISTAVKQGKATEAVAAAVVAQMAALNKTAAELMVQHGVHAATDVTGFGVLGHGTEMADGSGVTLKLDFDRIPMIDNVIEYAEQGFLTGGASANQDFLKDRVRIPEKLSKARIDVLYDAQTSGGLLMAFAPDDAERFKAAAVSVGLSVFDIGVAVKRDVFSIIVE
jgi:selenide,water dikinase